MGVLLQTRAGRDSLSWMDSRSGISTSSPPVMLQLACSCSAMDNQPHRRRGRHCRNTLRDHNLRVIYPRCDFFLQLSPPDPSFPYNLSVIPARLTKLHTVPSHSTAAVPPQIFRLFPPPFCQGPQSSSGVFVRGFGVSLLEIDPYGLPHLISSKDT